MKFLIIDKMHLSLLQMLEALEIQADYQPDIPKDEVVKILSGYEGLIVRSKLFIDDLVLNHAPKLKYICRAGAGIDNLDVYAIEKRGIKILNAPEGNRDAVGEHVVGMLLALFNQMLLADRQVRQKIWDREGNRGFELKGKTVGLIGYGFMGKEVARRLSSFDCKIIAYDKYLKHYSDQFVEESSLDRLFNEADVLSLHVPLTAETRMMVNNDFLSRFKKTIWLINSARGEILSLRDLVMALENGKVCGAALDVLENEKINKLNPEQQKDFDYLSTCDRVILTPHVAGWTYESYERINEVLVDKLRKELGK